MQEIAGGMVGVTLGADGFLWLDAGHERRARSPMRLRLRMPPQRLYARASMDVWAHPYVPKSRRCCVLSAGSKRIERTLPIPRAA
jgi:hypothetical protein